MVISLLNLCDVEGSFPSLWVSFNGIKMQIPENRDEVFKFEISEVSDFKFGKKVAKVFDDMVKRSVPFYMEIQRMIAELAADHAREGTDIYDLGCATGTTLSGMNLLVPESIRFVGIDNSQEMLSQCDEKLKKMFTRPYELRIADLHQPIEISNASVAVLCLTLQFIRPKYRERLLKNIYNGLLPGGKLILVEKVLTEDDSNSRDFIKYYHNYKRRNHYSDLEIAQKREALENVLVPYKCSENMEMLQEAGFKHAEIFFKWYNFAGILATRQEA